MLERHSSAAQATVKAPLRGLPGLRDAGPSRALLLRSGERGLVREQTAVTADVLPDRRLFVEDPAGDRGVLALESAQNHVPSRLQSQLSSSARELRERGAALTAAMR
jgi:hypothetical protein